jgi:hypothetical protein
MRALTGHALSNAQNVRGCSVRPTGSGKHVTTCTIWPVSHVTPASGSCQPVRNSLFTMIVYFAKLTTLKRLQGAPKMVSSFCQPVSCFEHRRFKRQDSLIIWVLGNPLVSNNIFCNMRVCKHFGNSRFTCYNCLDVKLYRTKWQQDMLIV